MNNTIDLAILPSKVVFVIWLQHQITNKRAKFSLTHNAVIILNTGISSMFGFGRCKKTNHPIIVVPKSLTPWFFIGGINRILIANGDSLFFEFGKPNNAFYLKLSTSKTRLKCLLSTNEDSLDLVRTIDIHGYSFLNNQNIELSKALERTPIQIIQSIDEVITPTTDETVDWSQNLNQDYDIYNVHNFEKLKDPLIY